MSMADSRVSRGTDHPALQEAADNAENAEERSRLQRAADVMGGVGKGVVTGVITHVLTQGP